MPKKRSKKEIKLQNKARKTMRDDTGGEYIDTVGIIIGILSDMEHSTEEELAILDKYIDTKPHKITPHKIANTLKYMRLARYKDRLADDLGVTFGVDGDIEFYYSFLFVLPDYDFSKTLLVKYDPNLEIENHNLDIDYSYDDTLKRLRETKEALVSEKQAAIDRLIYKVFEAEHRYLTPEVAAAYLKSMPPDAQLDNIELDSALVHNIIESIDVGYRVIEEPARLVVEKASAIVGHEEHLVFRPAVSYPYAQLYTMIWDGRDIESMVLNDIERATSQAHIAYLAYLDDLLGRMRTLGVGLGIADEVCWGYIYRFVDTPLPSHNDSKKLQKITRRIMYHFGEYIMPLRAKKMREELLAKTIRNFKDLFPLARKLKRELIFYAGPTNSGKTHAAMEHLASAQSGYYLAPLRLLALEGYETMLQTGLGASLITGEEEIIDDESTHVSSTIEMLNFEVDVECCVIDEIQMIDDKDRGWAWANALIGAPAKQIIMTGSEDAIDAVRSLAEYLGERLEVVRYDRKNPLEVMKRPTRLSDIKPHTAIVAFSRKEVLSYRQRLSPYRTVSVVYGNLSPEVRREEARKFRDGESDILIATDAIAMGLNLPIRTLLFAKDNKFDGVRRRKLEASEVLQISGRAGRYGMHEHGYIGALDDATLRTIARRFEEPLPDIELPFDVMASLHHVELIGGILETSSLLEILEFFAENMEFEGPFRAANIESMLEIAAIVDGFELDLKARYHLATAPVSINSPYIEAAFRRYLRHLERGESVPYYAPRDLPPYAHTNEELLSAEDRVKEVSLYLWLGYRFEESFPDDEVAVQARNRLNRFIEQSLTKGNFTKRCTRCGKILDLSYRYSVCESCYHKAKQRAYKRHHNNPHESKRRRPKR